MVGRGDVERRAVKPRGITVLLDANPIIADFRLGSAPAIALLSNSAMKTVAVAVPSVAIEEAMNKFREEVTRASVDIQKQVQMLKRLGIDADLKMGAIDDVCSTYAEMLGNRLSKYGVGTLPYPSVSHADVAGRAIAKRSPFDQQGRGYRDALVWHTVLELVPDREVWLISDDNDFRTPSSDELAGDLVSDLKTVGRSVADVRLFRSIKECVSELGQVVVQPKVDIAKRLKDDAGYLNVVTKGIEEGLQYKRLNIYELSPPAAMADEATIDAIEDVGSIYVQDARLVSTGELLVRLDATVDVEIGLLIDKSEVAEAENYYDRNFAIDDWDWNERMVSAHSATRLDVQVSAIADRETLDLQKIDVDGYSVVPGWS